MQTPEILQPILKQADLLPDVELQDHQRKVLDKLKANPTNMLLYHALGSGKTLTGIAAAEQAGNKYTAIVPASLRENFKHEQNKFTDMKLPSSVMSYSELARGKEPEPGSTLVVDESHRLKNPGALQTAAVTQAANKAKQTILMSGSPVTNDPAEFAPLMSILTKKNITPEEFRGRYVREKEISPGIIHKILGYTPGLEEQLAHPEELKELLKGHVDYYKPDKPVVPTTYHDIPVEMSTEQSQLYNAMYSRLPFIIRWKLKHQFPLSKGELTRMTSFLTGPREVGLSTLPFMRGNPDPYKAFQQSPKLQAAMSSLKDKLTDPRTKALVFSNFIGAGLTPYAAALEREKIPHAVFSGALNDAQRKQIVNDYNTNKIRVALLGPSGSEGLSFKGSSLVQLLDSHFANQRARQSVGRGLRYDSHFGLPEDLQNVTVQRYISRLPLRWKDRVLESLGFDREAARRGSDDYLIAMGDRKDKLNNQLLDLLKEVGSQPHM